MLEHRAGIEPANTDFADQRVSHFAIGAHLRRARNLDARQCNCWGGCEQRFDIPSGAPPLEDAAIIAGQKRMLKKA